MPSKGFLGIGSKPAKVRIWVELPDEKPAHAPKAERKPEAKPERKPAPEKKPEKKVEEKAEAKAEEPEAPEKTVDFGNKPEIVLNYVKSIVVGMGLDEAAVSVDTEGQNIKVQIDGDDAGITIGRRGETLDAIQYLAGLAANRGEGDFARVVVNSGTYRAKRRHTLEQLAKKLAVTAVRTGKSTTLEPMNPYERRIIHSAVAQVEGATSSSIGEEPNRCVVVSSTNPRPSR
ncbi:MAG: KH domain-containing protein, partial [Clostridia bacterium]|nr:KH domain-containing protein [Clostridia bacterium]